MIYEDSRGKWGSAYSDEEDEDNGGEEEFLIQWGDDCVPVDQLADWDTKRGRGRSVGGRPFMIYCARFP